MEKIKRGLITALQAFGIFMLSAIFYGFYPQNTLMSWICLIVSIGITYVFVAKSKSLAMGILAVYFVISLIVFWITGGFAALASSFTAWGSKTGPKLLKALQELIMFCIICFVLYKLFLNGGKSNRKSGGYVEEDDDWEPAPKKKEKKPRFEEPYRKKTGLINGSDEYWKIKEQAKRIYEHRVDSESTSEQEIWIRSGNNMSDRLREKYGYDDEVIEDLIAKYYLDRTL